MIRLFLNICKGFQKIKHLDESDIYVRLINEALQMAPSCPVCGAPSSGWLRNGSYSRHLVCYHEDSVDDQIVRVPSLLCPSCRHSHAVLLSLAIPCSSFSLGFLIALFYARITRRFSSVCALCEHFGISERTYYRLRRCLALDSKAFLDAMGAFLEAAGSFPDASGLAASLPSCDPISIHKALALFFAATGYSFLQPCIRFRPGGSLRSLPPGYCQIT